MWVFLIALPHSLNKVSLPSLMDVDTICLIGGTTLLLDPVLLLLRCPSNWSWGHPFHNNSLWLFRLFDIRSRIRSKSTDHTTDYVTFHFFHSLFSTIWSAYHMWILFNVYVFQQFFIFLWLLMQSSFREALVQSFQLAFSLRSISLGGGMFQIFSEHYL